MKFRCFIVSAALLLLYPAAACDQARLNGSGKLERFVLEIDREDDGTLLKKYYDLSLIHISIRKPSCLPSEVETTRWISHNTISF